MFRNYFKIAFRNLLKNRLYSTINLIGLSVGLASCLLIGVYILHELSYDNFHERKDRIVRTTMEYKMTETFDQSAMTGTKVGPEFKRTFPQVEEYVRTFLSHNTIKRGDKIFEESRILYADESFFRVFSFRILDGDSASALLKPDHLVLTQSMGRKYFGAEPAVGKTLHTMGKDYIVSAICDDVPQNSQLKFDFVCQFSNLRNAETETWWSANWITYLLLRQSKDLEPLQKQITAYMKSPAIRADAGLDGDKSLNYHLEPLTSVHLKSSLAGFEPNVNLVYIAMFMSIALLILLIACANYTNLATAQSAKRAAEIGMRKVLGASRKLVFFQFICESTLITIFASAMALVLAIFLLPSLNSVTDRNFTTEDLFQFQPILFLAGSTAIVSFLAGVYPAIVLSGGQTIGILKKGFSFTGNKSMVRKTLIVTQFSIAIFLIISTLIIKKQMDFMQTKNLGFEKERVVVLPVYGKMMADFENLKAAFSQLKVVEGVTTAYDTPEFVEWSDGIRAEGERGKKEISVNAMPVDLDFTKTMKMELAAGRDFVQSDFSLMDTTNQSANFRQPYLINETLARELGWKPQDAINKTIEKNAPGPIVGVVKDFHFNSMHQTIGPMLIFLGRDYARNLIIRIGEGDLKKSLSSLESVWKERVPDRPFSYHFLDDDYNKLYKAEERTSALFSVAASVAILLAAMGLFGLVAFTIVQRTKEIGIRKVLGASVPGLVKLLSSDFLKLVGFAILVASPLAWLLSQKWLEDFAYRIEPDWSIFLGTGLMALAIALATVAFQAIKLAMSNPVKSLRTE